MVSCSQDGGQSKKMACASFEQSGITPKIMVEIASNLDRRGTVRPTCISFYFDFGVTSHDLSLRTEFENGRRNLKTIFKFLGGNLKTRGGGIWDGGNLKMNE